MTTPRSWIMRSLAAKGYKHTDVRARIASFVERDRGIFCVYDIVRAVKRLDKVSIYRTLELLASLDLIHPIVNLGGVQYYELHGTSHHHHIVCTRCHRSACIDCDIPPMRVPGFQKAHHTFVVTALCDRCAKARVKRVRTPAS